MNIKRLKADKTEIAGLGPNAIKYYDAKSKETLGFVSFIKGEIFFFSQKVLPINLLEFIISDAQHYFSTHI